MHNKYNLENIHIVYFKILKKTGQQIVNVASHCPSNTIQKVLNFSAFMRPDIILQCLIRAGNYVHICKHPRRKFVSSTWKQPSFFPPQCPFFQCFFFFCSVQHKQPTTILYTATPVTHSLHKALHYFQKRTQHKKRDTGQPFVKKWRSFFLHTTQIVHSTQRGITAYQHHKK